MAVIRFDRALNTMRRFGGALFCFLVICNAATTTLANPRSCDAVKKDMEIRGFSSRGILDRPDDGIVCGEGSCCGRELEDELSTYSQTYIEKYVKDVVLRVATPIETRAKKFDEIFREMMNSSKREFHLMFERTYGKIYLQNADVFSDFFNHLETYYKKGTVRLGEILDSFFGILYQRMFTVINAQYSFDDTYINCVSNHMMEMKPFGDVPHKMSQQLKRSFVATRTFYKSLMRASEAVREVLSWRVDDACVQEIARMQTCGVCRGEMGAGACSQYCVDVLHVCLRNHMQLSESWDNFVDAIDKVADRLIGPYNIGSVVEPLNIKISEAVMNFQDTGVEVSQKIQSKCGSLSLKRPTRRADYEPVEENPRMEIQYDTGKTGKPSRKHKNQKQQTKEDEAPSLDKLIIDIKLKIKTTKQFWAQLPYPYCNNNTISAGPSEDGHCWNGTTIGSYLSPPKPKSFDQTEPTTLSPIVSGQIYVLNGLTDKLRKAYQGQDVEIIDDTEDSFDGSGSGSGDGENDDDVDEDPEDANNDNNRNNNNNNDDENKKGLNRDETIKKVNARPFPTPPPMSSTTVPPIVVRTNSSANKNSMSLTRALIQFLLPMVLAWFGGAIKDLL